MEKEAKANRRRCFMGENCRAHASIQTVYCVADKLIKAGQGQKYGGIFVYYIFLLLIDSIKLHNFKHF